MLHEDYTQLVVNSLAENKKCNPKEMLFRFFLIARNQMEKCNSRIIEAKIETHPELGIVLYLAHEDENLKFLRIHLSFLIYGEKLKIKKDYRKEYPNFIGELILDLDRQFGLTVEKFDISTRDHPFNEDVGARWIITYLTLQGYFDE